MTAAPWSVEDLADVDASASWIAEPNSQHAEPGLADRLGARLLSEISTAPAPPLICDRLDPHGHTILYGTGGVGKGVLVTSWIARMVAEGHRVLLVDYENHPEEWARRYAGLRGAQGVEAILHVAPLSS